MYNACITCTGLTPSNCPWPHSAVVADQPQWILLKASNGSWAAMGALIRKWSCVNLRFQFDTQITYKPTYMTPVLYCMLLFMIDTDIKFTHTNSAIRSSGHSRGLFKSASDYTSAQWRLELHILVTCSPHVNKCWVTSATYGIRWGWSHWPKTIQHVWAQWRSISSWRAWSTGSQKATRVSRSIGNILNGF